LAALEDIRPALFIVDIMMGGMDGFEFCRRIRAHEEVEGYPVHFLSARSDELDKVRAWRWAVMTIYQKPF
jgi:DNA-binding response OmpR family regulator